MSLLDFEDSELDNTILRPIFVHCASTNASPLTSFSTSSIEVLVNYFQDNVPSLNGQLLADLRLSLEKKSINGNVSWRQFKEVSHSWIAKLKQTHWYVDEDEEESTNIGKEVCNMTTDTCCSTESIFSGYSTSYEIPEIDLRLQIRRLDDENSSLREDLSRSEQLAKTLEKQRSELRQRLDQCLDRCQQLEKETDDQTEKFRELLKKERSCSLTLQKAIKENESLIVKLEEAESKLSNYSLIKSRHDKVLRENIDYGRRLIELGEKFAEKCDECAELKSIIIRLEETNLRTCEDKDLTMHKLREECRALTERNAELQIMHFGNYNADRSSTSPVSPDSNYHAHSLSRKYGFERSDSLYAELKASGFTEQCGRDDTRNRELEEELNRYNDLVSIALEKVQRVTNILEQKLGIPLAEVVEQDMKNDSFVGNTEVHNKTLLMERLSALFNIANQSVLSDSVEKNSLTTQISADLVEGKILKDYGIMSFPEHCVENLQTAREEEAKKSSKLTDPFLLYAQSIKPTRENVDRIADDAERMITSCQRDCLKTSDNSISPTVRQRSIHTLPSSNGQHMAERDSEECSAIISNSVGDGRQESTKSSSDVADKLIGTSKIVSSKSEEAVTTNCSDEWKVPVGAKSECFLSKDGDLLINSGESSEIDTSKEYDKSEELERSEKSEMLKGEDKVKTARTTQRGRNIVSSDKSKKVEKLKKAGKAEATEISKAAEKLGKTSKSESGQKYKERTEPEKSGQCKRPEQTEKFGLCRKVQESEKSGKAEKHEDTENKQVIKKTEDSKIPRRKMSVCHSSFDVSLLSSVSSEAQEARQIQEIRRIQKTQKMGKIKERKKFTKCPLTTGKKMEITGTSTDQDVDHNMNLKNDHSVHNNFDHNKGRNVDHNTDRNVLLNIERATDGDNHEDVVSDQDQGKGQDERVKVTAINDQVATISRDRKLVTTDNYHEFQMPATNNLNVFNGVYNNNNGNFSDTQTFIINKHDLKVSCSIENEDYDKDSLNVTESSDINSSCDNFIDNCRGSSFNTDDSESSLVNENTDAFKSREILFNTDDIKKSESINQSCDTCQNHEISFNTDDFGSSIGINNNDILCKDKVSFNTFAVDHSESINGHCDMYRNPEVLFDTSEVECSSSINSSAEVCKSGDVSFNRSDLNYTESIMDIDSESENKEVHENGGIFHTNNDDNVKKTAKVDRVDKNGEVNKCRKVLFDIKESHFTDDSESSSRMANNDSHDKEDRSIDDSELPIDADRVRLFVDYRTSTMNFTDSSGSPSPKKLILPDDSDVNSPNFMIGNLPKNAVTTGTLLNMERFRNVQTRRNTKTVEESDPSLISKFRLQPSKFNLVTDDNTRNIKDQVPKIDDERISKNCETFENEVNSENVPGQFQNGDFSQHVQNHKTIAHFNKNLNSANENNGRDMTTLKVSENKEKLLKHHKSDGMRSNKNGANFDHNGGDQRTETEEIDVNSVNFVPTERCKSKEKTYGGENTIAQDFEISANFLSSTPFPDKVYRNEDRNVIPSTSNLNGVRTNGHAETVERTSTKRPDQTYVVSSAGNSDESAPATTSSGAISPCLKVTHATSHSTRTKSGADELSVAASMSGREDDDSSCESDIEIDQRLNGSIDPPARDPLTDSAAGRVVTGRRKNSKFLALEESKNENEEEKQRKLSAAIPSSEHDTTPKETEDCHCRKSSSTQEDENESKGKPKAFPNLTDLKLQEAGIANLSDVNSDYSENLSESELESAYSALSISLGIDRPTLNRRMELSTRQRDQSEKNFACEVRKMQQDIQDLAPICTDRESIERVERVRHQLDMIARCAHRVSCAAETLGAIQQEYRISRGVLLADRYLQLLRSRCEKLSADMAETKRILAEINIVIEEHPGELGEDLPRIRYRCAGMPSNNRMMMGRRRASIAAIWRPLSTNEQDVPNAGKTQENPAQRNSVPERMAIRRPSLCYEPQKWDGQNLDRTEFCRTSGSVGELREIFEQTESRRNSREENNASSNSNNNDNGNDNTLRVHLDNLQLTPLATNCNGAGSDVNTWTCAKIERLQETKLSSLVQSPNKVRSAGIIVDRYWTLFLFGIFFLLGFFVKHVIDSYAECCDGPSLKWWSIEELLEQYIKIRHTSPRPI